MITHRKILTVLALVEISFFRSMVVLNWVNLEGGMKALLQI